MIFFYVNFFVKIFFLLFAFWLSAYFYGKSQIKQIGLLKLLFFGFFCVVVGLGLNFLFSEFFVWKVGFWRSGFIEDDLILFSLAFGLGVLAKLAVYSLRKK